MFEYVKDYGLKPARAYTKRTQTQRILLHMTGGGVSETVLGIHAYHISKGHKGIDYNICVERDGTVVWGRGLEYCGGSVNNSNARTKGMNDTSVAIVALGDFEHEKMCSAQLEGLKRIVRDVAKYYGITEIKGHYEVAGRDYTDCPGKYFPLDAIRSYAVSGTTQPTESNVPVLTRNLKRGMKGDDVKQAQQRLTKHNAQPGSVDGIFGSKTEAATKRFQQARKNEGRDIGPVDGIIGPKTWAILWE